MNTIELPPYCLTLLPPWPQAILYAGKDCENRSAGVAAQIGGYRGLVGLSQSKAFDRATQENIVYSAHGIRDAKLESSAFAAVTFRDMMASAGKLFIVANLVSIARPHEARGNSWHVPGQHGLLFDKVWEVEPTPCTGGVGAWRPHWCTKCRHIYSDTSRVSSQCYSCKAVFPENRMGERGRQRMNANCGASIDRPQLKVVRECVVS